MELTTKRWTKSFYLAQAACLVMLVGVLAPMAMAQQLPSEPAPSFGGNVKPLFFPFDIHSRVVNPKMLDTNAAWLTQNPDAKMWIQGYADPRGDIVYNLVLSYRRSQFVKAQLVKRGVADSRFGYCTGWGKLYQTCDKAHEDCWQENRRADIIDPETTMFHFAR